LEPFPGSPLFIGFIDPGSITLDPVLDPVGGTYGFVNHVSEMSVFVNVSDQACFTVGECTGEASAPDVTLSDVPEPPLPLLVIGILGLVAVASSTKSWSG
jgi:hypothetical protein